MVFKDNYLILVILFEKEKDFFIKKHRINYQIWELLLSLQLRIEYHYFMKITFKDKVLSDRQQSLWQQKVTD